MADRVLEGDMPGAVAMAALVREGRASAEDLTRACLARIAEAESSVHAWAWLDPDAALAEARARDRSAARGPLHGVPVAVKDIIDTADMPTEYGSAIYAGHRPARDAACVAALRAAGAVILGKTVTTEFATFRPGPTRNPHDPARTPGGSSSGSAAAVGAGMVPLALGTQTVGSVIRPASFCGVVGFKAGRGRLALDGVKPLAADFDSLGVFARDVGDAALWFAAMAGGGVAARTEPPRIAFVRTAEWGEAAPETRATVEAAASRLAADGATVEEPRLSGAFGELAAAQDALFAAGAVEALSAELSDHAGALSPQLWAVLERGLGLAPATLAEARRVAEACRAEMSEVYGRFDAALAPAAPGEAPEGLGSTGNPLFNRVWTALLGPCLTLPAGRGPNGMPVGIQLAGPSGGDEALLATAGWVERALA